MPTPSVFKGDPQSNGFQRWLRNIKGRLVVVAVSEIFCCDAIIILETFRRNSSGILRFSQQDKLIRAMIHFATCDQGCRDLFLEIFSTEKEHSVTKERSIPVTKVEETA